MDPTCTSRAPGAPRSPRRAPAAAGAALVAGLLLVACGGSASSAPAASSTTQAPSTSTTLPTTTTTAPTPEAELLEVYLGYLEAFIASNDPPDPDHDQLGRFTTGRALAKAREVAIENRATGISFRRPTSSEPVVEVLSVQTGSGIATMDLCLVDDGQVVDSATGLVLNDRVASKHWTVEFVQEGSEMKVEALALHSTLDGAVPCR